MQNDLECQLIKTLDDFEFREYQKELLSICLTMVKDVDIPTYEHSLRSGFKNLEAGNFLGLDSLICFCSGLLHDVGKVLTDRKYLRIKKGFSLDDKQKLYTHPLDSYRITKNISGVSPICAEIVLRHHLFGKDSYPKELPNSLIYYSSKEKDLIYRHARILSLVESYDACLYRENDRNSPGNPRFLNPSEVREVMFRENEDQKELLSSFYDVGIFK